jgi:adenosine deaminase
MNILVTTLGASWQILPELVGWTNPLQFDFFKGYPAIEDLRRKHDIEAVNEFWVVTTDNQKDMDKLKTWISKWHIEVKFFICNGITEFSTEDEVNLFRSFLFRVVLKASELCKSNGKLYLSLAGGRKTMSADMYEAGSLFGCDAMFHIQDINPPKEVQTKDDLLLYTEGKYARYYLPIVINEQLQPNFVVSGGEKRIVSDDYPIEPGEKKYKEDGSLGKIVAERKKNSQQVYANFYNRLRNSDGERDIFRQLYYLHPDSLQKLKDRRIGSNITEDIALLKRLPKADLHTHLGGVLCASEIIEVAKAVSGKELANKSETFQKHIKSILEYKNKPEELDKLIFSELLNEDNYYRIGIDPYQKLGGFQGSALLQTKETIATAIEIYARKLIDDNVKYVEIRCSPYKYTREKLTVSEVVDCIMDAMDKFSDKIMYNIICIVGRQSGHEEIEQSISEIINLLDNNEHFANKLVGIDLAGNESSNSPKQLRELFMPFLKRCIHITIHAGETEPVDSIWEAVYHLSADRIGHGLKLLDRKEFIPRLVDKNIGVEMCPSSNRQIVGYGKAGDATYPLKEYMKRGLKVTLNTDNQGISRTTASNEYFVAARLVGGLSLWDCIVLIRNSLIVSFADNKTKLKLLREFESTIYDICNNL